MEAKMNLKLESNSLNRLSKLLFWIKRVFFQDKTAKFVYKENQLNIKFNQYYKFLEALKSYEIITLKEALQSGQDIREQQVEEYRMLAKSIWPEKFNDKYQK
jgi:hypothetical protein